MTLKDLTMYTLSTLVVLGFFWVLAWKLKAGQDVSLEIGMLGSTFSGVMGYWFGSSLGSARKTELLAQKDQPNA